MQSTNDEWRENYVCITYVFKFENVREIFICIYLNLLEKNVSLLSDKIMWNVKSEKIRDLRYTLRETSLPRNL